MLRRSLFVSALILAGVVGFASSAKAGTAPVTFTGSVGSSCTLGTTTPGTLGVNGDGNGLGTTAAYNTSVTPLAGKIALNCTKDATLGLTVTEAASNPTTGTTMAATMVTTGGTASVTGGTATVGTPVTLTKNINETANIDLTVAPPASVTLASGSYSYTVTVTGTP